MTLNTLYRPPLDGRWVEMAAWIASEQPDVVCLQEVQEQPDGSTVAARLATTVEGPWYVAIGSRGDLSGRGFGNAVLSRWPIDVTSTHDLPCDDAFPRVLLHARTAGIDIFCVHLTADVAAAPVREEQVLLVDHLIRTHADPSSPLPPVLAGDFNAPPSAAAIGFLRGELALRNRGTFFQDAWAVAGDGVTPGNTWDHRNPLAPPTYLMDSRCDYIFVGLPKVPIGWSTGAHEHDLPVGQVVAARLVCHRPITGMYASDHYGLVAEICWPERDG